MARKKFTRDTKGLDALLSTNEDEEVQSQNKERDTERKSKSSDEGKIKEFEKISFNLEVELSEKLKAYSYEKRKPITKFLKLCVEEFLIKIPEEDMRNALKIWRSAER